MRGKEFSARLSKSMFLSDIFLILGICHFKLAVDNFMTRVMENWVGMFNDHGPVGMQKTVSESMKQ